MEKLIVMTTKEILLGDRFNFLDKLYRLKNNIIVSRMCCN